MSEAKRPEIGFDSQNTEVIICAGPGDTTVRPASPSMRKLLEAERDKIARWQHLQDAMPGSTRVSETKRPEIGFDSQNTEVIICDGPGDTTVRPASPSMRKLLEAERAKIARWRHAQEPTAQPDTEAGNA